MPRSARLALRSLLVAILLAAGAAGAAFAGVPEGWRVLGSGEMRWFGFKLYDAKLWVPATASGASVLDSAFALELRYARDIASARLVEASLEEMQRFGPAEAGELALWREVLGKVFPDVKPGEVIVGRHDPQRGAEFFHQGRRTGSIDDLAFARRFFAIWLDPRTREPALRQRLLGSS
jgi:hypothetical protein